MSSFRAALCGVVMYNYIKVKDTRASQLPPESLPERMAKVSILDNDDQNDLLSLYPPSWLKPQILSLHKEIWLDLFYILLSSL